MIPVEVPQTVPGLSATSRQALRALYSGLTALSPALAARLALRLFVTPVCRGPSFAEHQVLRQARQRGLRFGRESLRTFEWGTCGPVVILAHGWSSRAARLSHFVAPLLRAGCRVVAFDAPGHGASSGTHSHLALFREALHVVIGHTGRADAVIGYSLGARAALLHVAAGGAPPVRALALISMPPDVAYILEEFKLVLDLRAEVCKLLDEAFERAFGAPPERHSAAEHAASVQCPVLVLHDVDDDVAPVAHAECLARQLPQAKLRISRGLNHCGLLRDPAAIDEVVAFITAHLGAGPRNSGQARSRDAG